MTHKPRNAMTNNIINFPGQTAVDLPADQVLEAAIGQQFSSMVIVGMNDDGKLYLAGSTSDLGIISLLHRRLGVWIDQSLAELP